MRGQGRGQGQGRGFGPLQRAVLTHAVRVALVVAFVCVSLFSLRARAEIPSDWVGQKIVDVRVAGEQMGRVAPADLFVEKGATLTRGLVREAIQKLADTGRWAQIEVDAVPSPGGGIALVFHLSPRLIAQRVEIVGNAALDDLEVGRLVGVREEAEIDDTAFATWAAAVREAYRVRGYREASVRLILRDTEDPGRKVVRVEIEEGEPTRIIELVFLGDPLPKRKGLGRVLRFQVGDIVDEAKIKDSLERGEELLRRTGFYQAGFGEPRIEFTERRARVLIPSTVGPYYEVRFHGHEPLDRSELFKALDLGAERLVGDASLHALESRLIDVYRRYGFRDAQVRITTSEIEEAPASEDIVAPWEKSGLALDVHITPGMQLEIAAITFPGATHFDSELLRDQIYSYLEEDLSGSTVRMPVDSDVADRLGFGGGVSRAERSSERPLVQDPRRIFYAPTYEQAIEHVRELYRADGFLSVQVSSPVVTPLPEAGHAVVEISVVEGPRTFVYALAVEGNEKLASQTLLTAAGLTRGAPFSYLKLEEARLRVVDTYQEEGFFYATVEPRVRMSEDHTRAEITFDVVERFVVYVGDIEVRGDERSNQSMIRNRVLFKRGDIYRPSVARKTQDALFALDIFTSVTVAPDAAELPARMKTVVVSVAERKTQFLGWNAGFSTGEGGRGGFEYGYRNLFGSAVHATFRGQLGYQFVFLDQQIQDRYTSLNLAQRLEYQATLTTGIPYIPHLPKNSITVDLVSLQDLQRDFRIRKQSVVGTIFYRPTKRITLSTAEEIESSDFYLFALQEDGGQVSYGNLQTSAIVPPGQNTLASTQLNWAWDLRDRAYNPKRGILLSLNSEWAHTLQDKRKRVVVDNGTQSKLFRSNQLRFLASAAFYVPLASWLVFATQARYGRIVHLERSSQSFPNRRFYLGGANFRGYNQNQMIPEDVQKELKDNPELDSNNIVSRGGETFIAVQSELRFPIVSELYGGVFTDVGNLWANPKALDLTELQTTVGVGLRFQTPVASLALDYGVRTIETQPFDLVGAFQFAFQTF